LYQDDLHNKNVDEHLISSSSLKSFMFFHPPGHLPPMAANTDKGVTFDDSAMELLLWRLPFFLIGAWIGWRFTVRLLPDPALEARVVAAFAAAVWLVKSLLVVPLTRHVG
jgi:hypothetical protein